MLENVCFVLALMQSRVLLIQDAHFYVSAHLVIFCPLLLEYKPQAEPAFLALHKHSAQA